MNKTTTLPPTKINMFTIPARQHSRLDASPENTISSHQARSNSVTDHYPEKVTKFPKASNTGGTIPILQFNVKGPSRISSPEHVTEKLKLKPVVKNSVFSPVEG